MVGTARSRNSTNDSDFKRTLLNSIALFRGVDPDEISDLLAACGRLDVEKGRTLLSPESENQCVFVLLSGELAVHVGALDGKRISTLAPGSCAGEMSIVDDRDPSLYVIATEDCHLMVISYQLLWDMVDRSHTFAKNLLVVMSERVRSDNAFIASSLDVIRQAERAASTDALTGLGNRHWMNEMFDREIIRAQRSGDPACLLMVDVDGFKLLNDRYGHIAGDNVITRIAQVIGDLLRPRDLVARFGGDEFAVLLPGLSGEQGLETAERLRLGIRESSPEGLLEPITVSIGLATLEHDDTLNELIDRADSAMYRAKADGRDRVVGAHRNRASTKF